MYSRKLKAEDNPTQNQNQFTTFDIEETIELTDSNRRNRTTVKRLDNWITLLVTAYYY
jgi:hypothetical protein